ncbi:DUF4302 domain-containing protein [Porphyromonas pogonae]|uniref:DUF4302 domain-containing protein n=1 Tax=Porphyromonas pogonae TaxID=867595 RepID=UPI002E77BCC6|nr:DUF4302 domain-containing protein [Porphyromonas pogonae]
MKYLIILFLTSFFISCSQDVELSFKNSPVTRTEQSIALIREKLVSAENGWEMTYFPHVDSTKFSDIRKDLNEIPHGFSFIRSYFGIGGYKFFIKFYRNGTLEMLSDRVPDKPRTSQFEVSMGAYAQLSFTTPNYHLIGRQNDFLFNEETSDGQLVFRTLRHKDQGMEYIVMKKLPLGSSIVDIARKVSENRTHFEKMGRYILTITDAKGRVRYETNYAPNPQQTYSDRIINPDVRYIAFLRKEDLDLTKTGRTGLASGYSPSLEGVEFFPGLRFSQEILFNYFTMKSENHYISEVKGFKATITYPKK